VKALPVPLHPCQIACSAAMMLLELSSRRHHRLGLLSVNMGAQYLLCSAAAPVAPAATTAALPLDGLGLFEVGV